MKSTLRAIYNFLEAIGQARAACYHTRLGRWKAAQYLYK
jgi:hypothetical protein